MTSEKIATLDRRVRVEKRAGSHGPTFHRISELRTSPFVVILGEPGIGKSTVLEQEAASEHTVARKVRDVVTGVELQPGAPLFVDALDEYRIDGSAVDKAHSLGLAMTKAKPSRWRLTCRAEDWNKSADLAAIRDSVAGQEIVIAQLLPLTDNEAASILESLGESDPARFLTKAQSLGAQSLLRSPLSLKLLHAAVSSDADWPSNRHDLFARAIPRLATEYNDIHRGGVRQPLPQIIEAAEKACLVMLLSGRRTLWRSHDEPPASGDDRAYLRGYELEFADLLFRDMLDTSLFQGEGESFEPMHRTVAEYLAGRALAKAVVGRVNAAAFPFGRAVAMVTGIDRKAPTELRGVYAWFAAHLANLGREDDARQLIEADAATVLAYGDTAIFSTALRRTIFTNLHRDDPYFRSDDHMHDTAVGGLAGKDLADDFAAEMDNPTAGTHRLVTVFEALTSGSPIESLRQKLWDIALDVTRPEWQRRHAADAWLNGADDRVRELFDAITGTPPSADRELLRIHLAELMRPETLAVEDIKSLIADFAATAGTHTVGRLVMLAHRLSNVARGELFDVHLNAWIPEKRRTQSVEIEGFVDFMLATSIRLTPNLMAARLWNWANNVRHGRWDNLGNDSRKALQLWLDTDPTREAAILDVIIDDDDARGAPHMPANNYIILTGRGISAELIRHILATVGQMPVGEASKSRLAVAVDMAGRLRNESITAEAMAIASSRPDSADLVTKLIGPPPDDSMNQRRIAAEAARREKDSKQKAENIAHLTPDIEDIRMGLCSRALGWAARLYFEEGDGERPGGLEKVIYFSDEAIAEAIVAGWDQLIAHGSPSITAKFLGQGEGKYLTATEWGLLAGIDRLFHREPGPGTTSSSLIVALAILKAAWNLRDAAKRKQFEHWALERLNAEPIAGAAHLHEYWTEAVDVGTTHIESFGRVREDDAHGPAVVEALYAVLNTRPSMPLSLLRSALRAAVKRIELKRLLALATAAMADPVVTGEQRLVWSFMAFALDPGAHGASLVGEHGADGGVRVYEEFRGLEYEHLETIEPAARAMREGTIIRVVGPKHPPQNDKTGEEDLTSTSADIIRRAIQRIGAYPDVQAGREIKSLAADSTLAAWKTSLQHAYAQWARLYRESTFRYPTPKAIIDVLSGGTPANAADLMAVVMEELLRLRRELRTGSTTPWKAYWNTDSSGKVGKPQIENQCRDRLLERLMDRFERYKISEGFGEARRPEDRRADMLFLNGAGKSIPVEVKRHFNAELWTSPMSQLHGYTQAEGSDGYGIYLVFWFGLDQTALPKREDGATLPTSPKALEDALVADLPAASREQLRVLVFDVSKQAAGLASN